MALPNLTYFAEGQIAAYRIFAMIDRVPQIDSDDMTGTVLENIVGEIEFRNVAFSYPSRPKQSIFRDFCLTVPAGYNLSILKDQSLFVRKCECGLSYPFCHLFQFL